MDSTPFPLYELAKSDLFNEQPSSNLKIPNIQRGLVWDASQDELLWDSILRGFPIGSMLILKNKDGIKEILDGQQRANAIINGYNDSWNEPENKQPYKGTILWLDLGYKPRDNDLERRKFGIRSINSSHPWGYDSNTKKLDAGRMREARDKVFKIIKEEREIESEDKLPKKSEWDIRKFIPISFVGEKDFLPIPLSFLVKAAENKKDNEESFRLFIKEINEQNDKFSQINDWWNDNYKERIIEFFKYLKQSDQLYKSFCSLNNYKIIFNVVSQEDDIELLFNRINSKGTRMSPEDLSYAAIKYYGSPICNCDRIGDVIKQCDILPEPQMAQIILRYCFSFKKDSIRGVVDAGTIRKLAQDSKDNKLRDEKNKLVDFFKDDATKLKKLIKEAQNIILNKYELPPIMLAEIGKNNPPLFILLLRIIEDNKHKLENNFIRSIILYLYCFSVPDNDFPAQMLYKIANSPKEDYKEYKSDIQNCLRDAISQEWCYELPDSFKNFKALDDNELNKDWNISNYSDEFGYKSFQTLFNYNRENFQGGFMLKYAQRIYFNDIFGDYDPSDRGLWKDINKPWDDDHIIPKSWINDNAENNCLWNWLNSWGNIAYIPSEENRSKGNRPDWTYYEKVNKNKDYVNKDVLKTSSMISKIKDINKDGLVNGDDKVLKNFMGIIRERFLEISTDFLDLLKVLDITTELSKKQIERKVFLEKLRSSYSDSDGSEYGFYYLTGTNGIEKEITEKDNLSCWQKPWVSIIHKGHSEWEKAITVHLENNGFRIQRGFRKRPDRALENDVWWEKGSFYECDRRNLLKNEKEITLFLKYFCLCSDIQKDNKDKGRFTADDSGLLSYEGILDNQEIKMNITKPWYKYRYFEIKSKNNEKLPDSIITKGKEMEYYTQDDLKMVFRLKNNIDYTDNDNGRLFDEFTKHITQFNRINSNI